MDEFSTMPDGSASRNASSSPPPPPREADPFSRRPQPTPYAPPVETAPQHLTTTERQTSRRFGWMVPILAGLIGSLITVGALWALGVFSESEKSAAPPTVATQPEAEAAVAVAPITITPLDGDARVAAVAAKAIASIVTVQVGDNISFARNGETESRFEPFGTGSGVVFESDGFILTNNHVVEDTVITKVVFADGRVFAADVIGTDPLTDIAVIKIAARGLPTIEFANMDELAIGDLAIAVGNPLGLDGGPSVTAGIVSAFNRSLQTGPDTDDKLHGLLQTDAPITRGSSGGALLNDEGKLIGITTAIGISDVGAEGLGFAVPADMVMDLASDLINDGEVRHAFLGISVGDAMIESANGVESPAGAEIILLLDASAIASAGAEEGDIIKSIDGVPINTSFDLLATLRGFRAGDVVDVQLERSGNDLTISVELDLRPEN